MKFFSKNYTLYGVYISLNFGFRLNLLAFKDTKMHFYISEVVERSKEFLFRFKFYKFIEIGFETVYAFNFFEIQGQNETAIYSWVTQI